MKTDQNSHSNSQMDLSFPAAAAIGFHTLNVYSNAYSHHGQEAGGGGQSSCTYFPANYYNASYHHHHHPAAAAAAQHGLMNLQRPGNKSTHDYTSSG